MHKVKMLQTRSMAHLPASWTFHKGRTYHATFAANIPNAKARGLYFVEKRRGEVLLLSVADGEIEMVA
jgi:hypothetical protein